ncbi:MULTISPECIES: heme-binding protein [unclassified Actinopolyspora]|uniref:GlcG/HbpS family heme-binding protein n=1 Tax=unclassified Actinopolyspora TaxID=2639451 RepID=UPI0013F660EA|nr:MULTISPECIES: heme-binding protein [unclassified Actinopolyspora]NHD16059.1 heme-binding protein [Actinopolyspora sp. BKK2]NHE74727.1 heme-binding protein [Actinopolyspora sp. BKK1]
MNKVVQRSSISDELAGRIVRAADEAAKQGEQRFAVAVVDESGQLKAFLRQDGAKLNAVQVAQDKAYTAASSKMSTETWSEKLSADAVLGAAAPTTIDRLAPMGGGLPIVVDGETVGAVGVSGAHWTDDVKIAEAGLRALD